MDGLPLLWFEADAIRLLNLCDHNLNDCAVVCFRRELYPFSNAVFDLALNVPSGTSLVFAASYFLDVATSRGLVQSGDDEITRLRPYETRYCSNKLFATNYSMTAGPPRL